MSRGNRGYYIALGVALLLAAIAGAWLYNDASALQRVYEHQASEKAQNYRDAARVRAQARCTVVPRAEIRQCVQEEYDAARKGEHDEYDLQAQLVTSVWTRAMGIAALIAMAVGIFGVGLIYATFQETRRTAKSAEDTLDHARDVSKAELRPWVSIDLVLAGFEMDDQLLTLTYELQFENLGRSVASEFHYGTQMTFLAEKPAEYIDDFFAKQIPPKKESKAVVLPGEIVPGRGATMRATDHIAWSNGSNPRVSLIVVVATAFYKSPFDDEWHRTDRSFFVGQKDDQNILSGRLIREDLRTNDLDRMAVVRARAGETT
jgi:hypothetical protein